MYIWFMFANVKGNRLAPDSQELQLCGGEGPLWPRFHRSVGTHQKRKQEKCHFLIPPTPILFGPSITLWERVAELPPLQYFRGEWEVWETGEYPKSLTKDGPFVNVFVVPVSQFRVLNEQQDRLTELRVINISKRPAEAPSSGARPSIFNEEQKRNPIAMGRPKTSDHFDIPISLLHPTFAQFKKNIVSGPIDRELSPLAWRWTGELSDFFPDETARETKFHELLSTLLDGFKISKKKFSNYTTDGGIDPKEFIDLFVKPLLVEVKAETTSGLADAILQAILYDREAIRLILTSSDYDGPWRKTRLASILVIHNAHDSTCTGPNIQVLGVVWLAEQYVEVLSPSFPLHFNEFDTPSFENLLRFMTSLCSLFRSLLDLYKYPEQHAVQYDQVAFPYPSFYDVFEGGVGSSTEVNTGSTTEAEVFNGSAAKPVTEPQGELTTKSRTKVHFRYTERVDPIRLVFKACTTEEENIIIKFGYGQYGINAHRAAAENHLAPALLGYSRLTGGWWMVAMELLHEDFQSCAKVGVKNPCKSVIKTSISALHAMGFVHGDLRASNVLVRKYVDQWECKLIDFDWAGRAEQVKYPFGVYRTLNMFRPLANMDRLPITKNDDILTLNNTLAECQRALNSMRHGVSNISTNAQHRCKAADCPPFGPTRTCKAVYISQLSLLVKQCCLVLPSLNLERLLTLENFGELEAVVDQQFSTPVPAPANSFYINSEAHIKILQELTDKLSLAAMLCPKFTGCLKLHEYVPSDGLTLVTFANVHLLLECTNTKRISLEEGLWKAYDDYPDKTAGRLRLIMDKPTIHVQDPQTRRGDDPFPGMIPHMNISHFGTLGVGRWVNDEIVNHFVTKWCTRSGTMGLSTFFANGHLFQSSESEPCVHAKVGTLTAVNEIKVLRWCSKTICLVDDWDSVFIPINERSTHWYSAYIDFRHRRIEIFDSLEINCTNNQKKPITHQKNMQLMLVLMWLAEVLGRLRGEPVFLKNDPETEWICEPHSQVPFQPNTYDCGIHTLWHLRHVLEFRQIRQGVDVTSGLAFSDNMIGKRLRLAGEILKDYRILHVRLKNDVKHKKFHALQVRNISSRFERTAEAALNAANGPPQYSVSETLHNNSPSVPRHGLVYPSNSRDHGDIIDDMDIDDTVAAGNDADNSDIVSVTMGESLEQGEKRRDEDFNIALDIAADILQANEANEDVDIFDFLPAPLPPNLPKPTAHNAPMTRPLFDEDPESRTWIWHSTAGKNPDASEAYHPFTSRLEWELAQWAIKEKITHSSFNRLLTTPQVKERLGVGFSNARSMLNKVDEIPERCGAWYTKEFSFRNQPDETFTIRHRDPLEAIKALWSDPKFSKDLVYRPAKLFRSKVQSEDERIFSEMWTGGFWNAAQECIPEGGTIAPVIIASDKTQLTQFSGNKSAYPVYLTLGNIPKALRRKPGARACILIAYLSVDKPTKNKQSKTTLKLRNYELFHRSMAVVLESLKAAGKPEGPGVEMAGGDGAIRQVYPLLATYVADYPEQCLVTCTKYGTCPKCRCSADDLGLTSPGERRTQKWTTETIRAARVEMQGKGEHAIHRRTMEEDISGGNYDPFWVGFPLTDIHRCIAPDILHQLYQGVFKHLVSWVQKVVGEAELDDNAQCVGSLLPQPKTKTKPKMYLGARAQLLRRSATM
ncbi:hypothetical protein D9757_015360 [Collybiopsis confluens]|uniref:Ubiquitin-like protease family profile domain-containing protein n=1 Tax=Collybiopsis confluens TaxID=2823264 RepID=A0A8H5C5I0_9AGAR|nr:hypothetical protein D9757_015360 [Collybiopsis confluens]